MGLKIKNVRKEAAGTYTCKLTYDINNETLGEEIKTLPLTVLDAPPDIQAKEGW